MIVPINLKTQKSPTVMLISAIHHGNKTQVPTFTWVTHSYRKRRREKMGRARVLRYIRRCHFGADNGNIFHHRSSYINIPSFSFIFYYLLFSIVVHRGNCDRDYCLLYPFITIICDVTILINVIIVNIIIRYITMI